MKGGVALLVASAALLVGVAWFAWIGPRANVDVDAPRLPGEAPEAPVELPETLPTFVPQRPGNQEPSWTLLNDKGIRALEAGEHEAAIVAFEACLEANPDEDVYARNLAEALARAAVAQHDAAETDAHRLAAITLLERATGLDPEREKLLELLDRWKRSAAAEKGFFEEYETHFVIAYDLDRGEVRVEMDQVKRLLEEAYQQFHEDFGGFDPVPANGRKIRVVLYTREGFDRVTGIGPWAGGVYDGTIRVPVGDLTRELPRVRKVLRHELLHAFVQELGGAKVPAWLNEGLAQWQESPSYSDREHEVSRARAKLAGAELFDLASLGGSLASWTDQDAIERAYAEALTLVGWIARQYGERVLFDLVQKCGEGVLVDVAFQGLVHQPLQVVLEDMAAGL